MVKTLVQTMIELWYGPYENFINTIKEQNEEKALRYINEIDPKEFSKANDNGYTILMSVANKGLYTVCERLASKMPYEAINQVNNRGDTALSLAENKKFKDICNLLCEINFQKLKDKLNNKIKTITIDQEQIKQAADNIWDAANSINCSEDKREIENLVKPLLNNFTKKAIFGVEIKVKRVIEQQKIEHNKLKEQLKAQEVIGKQVLSAKIATFEELINKLNCEISNKDSSSIKTMLEGISAKIDKLNNIVTKKTANTEEITDDARNANNNLQALVKDINEITKVIETVNKYLKFLPANEITKYNIATLEETFLKEIEHFKIDNDSKVLGATIEGY
ncbi:ankyrin repeat domain-containing protein [Rickettsia bellii]|uniref:Ankyrin repeat n=1 Tax=Rickettsia bellii (strain RML369-C) TaxID=336407 RepID=Q1RHU8_RICBR|nr:ankyrin repeat domain-containing protein [Rickettsia bellii]ABE05066.1 Ankyrin repeat [Rickettsia bellii RML369-C]ABV79099.1 Ankyrin repeat [Rickettsia bellii OSU 85-389]